MLTKALILTDGEADLLSRVLEEVETKTFEESQISLDDVGALNALVSHFSDAEKVEPDKEARQISVNPLGKRLFLGHIIGREGRTETASESRSASYTRRGRGPTATSKCTKAWPRMPVRSSSRSGNADARLCSFFNGRWRSGVCGHGARPARVCGQVLRRRGKL